MADTLDEDEIVYNVTNYTTRSSRGALVDRGANGGILGSDAKPFFQHTRTVNVTGIDNHELNHLKIVDASAKVMTQRGPVIIILKQYAWHGTGRTIHSSVQLEHYKNQVDDKSVKAGGRQCITTLEGYVFRWTSSMVYHT